MITSVGCLLNVSKRFNSAVKIFYPTPKNEASFHRAADCQTYLHFLKSSNCTRMAEISGKPYCLYRKQSEKYSGISWTRALHKSQSTEMNTIHTKITNL